MTNTAQRRPTQARVVAPRQVRPGEPFAVRASILHPMINGHQNDDQGRRQVREIVTRFECHSPTGLLFAMNLHPAVAANPSVSFWLQLDGSTELRLVWWGDAGFHHQHVHTVIVS